jgi:hypothetical protein
LYLTAIYNTLRLVAAEMAKLEPNAETGERGTIVATASIAGYHDCAGHRAHPGDGEGGTRGAREVRSHRAISETAR